MKRRQLLWAVNLLLALGIAGAAALVLFPPRPRPRPEIPAPTESAEDEIGVGRTLPVNSYAAIYKNNLQAPLTDKPANKLVPTGPSPIPKLSLTGTVIEPGNSYAIFRTTSGQIKLAGVGEEVDGAKIVAVTEDSVKLTSGGRAFTLTIPPGGRGQ